MNEGAGDRVLKNKLRNGFYLGEIHVRPPSGAVVHPDGTTHHLQPKAMEVLLCLAAAPGDVVERAVFRRDAWGGAPMKPAALSHSISEVRHALGDHADNPVYVQTLPGRGYCLLIEPVAADAVPSAPLPPEPTAAVTPSDPLSDWWLDRLLREIKERKILREAGIYLAMAWLIVQVQDVLCGPLQCADWLPRATILLLASGFPIALVLAWRVNIRLTPVVGRILDALLVGAVGAAIGMALYLFYVHAPVPTVPPPKESVAVMPFRDRSPARDQDYFCKGIVEAIIHRLTQLPRLKVASQTDTLAMPDATTIKEIGERLGVSHVLVGSVRRQQNLLRITTQLSDTATGFHVWSQEYERDLEDVFDIQDDIAQRVVKSLNLVIQADQDPDRPATLEAYENYLKGREQLRGRRSSESLDTAQEFFDRAIAADPGYAGAYAGLCDTFLTRYELSRAKSHFDNAKTACGRALQYESAAGPVYVALGNLYRVSGEYRQAQKQFDKALEIDRYDVDAFVGKARTFARQNKLDKAEKTLERTLDIQPQFWRGHLQMGNFLFNDGRYREAVPYYNRVVMQLPNDAVALNNLGSAYFMTGDFDQALRNWRRSLELEPTRTAYSNVGSSLFYSRRFAEAARMYRQAIELAPEDYEMYGNLASALMQLGDTEDALANYRRAAALAEIALGVNPRDAYTVAALSVYYAALQIPERALELAETARRLAPQDNYLHYELARAHVLLRRHDAAIDALERAVALGYPRVLIPADAALDPLRQHPGLASILKTDEKS